MNPYYQNWNYGYTLAPSTQQSRGAYTVYDHGESSASSDSNTWLTGSSQSANNGQLQEGNNTWLTTGSSQSATKGQAFVTSSNRTLSQEISTSQFIGPQVPERVPPSTQVDPQKAIVKLHELAVANRLIERYETVQEPVAGNPQQTEYKVKLFIGTETYEGAGTNLKMAKQNAALQALVNTKYRTTKEQKLSMFATAKRIGVTATSELHELAAKKGVNVDFKFLEPLNFEFKHSMRMWSKKEMLGNYRVQLNVCGYEFYGQAELPQQAKHNAATQAIPIVRALPEPSGQGHVIATPGAIKTEPTVEKIPESISGKNINMTLNEIALLNSCVPDWTLISETGPPHQKVFTWQLQLGEFTTVGTGPNKKAAKQGASEQMLATLPEAWKQRSIKKGSLKRKVGKGFTYSQRKKGAGATSPAEDDGKIVIAADNPISCLHEYAKKRKIPDPQFQCVSENILDTCMTGNMAFKKIEYTMKLDMEGKTYLASALTKKAAKQACASEAWNEIRPRIV